MQDSDQVTVEQRYLQNQKSVTLGWRSFLQWGGDHVAVYVACKSWQQIGYA